VLESGALDPACHRGEPTLWASLAYFLKLERLFPRSKVFGQYHMGWLDMHVAHQIAACSGAAMLVRTAAIRQVGIFDEQFFMYAEDLDWCRRFREANWQVWYVPQASVTHIKYQSGLAKPNTTNISQTRHYFYQTMLQYFEKHSAAHTPRIISMMVRTALRYKQGGA
jgi:GT2 family glycosyltransferase